MKKALSILVLIALLVGCGEHEENSRAVMLKIKTVELTIGETLALRLVTAVDEKQNEVTFSDYPEKWFANATAEKCTMNGGFKMDVVNFKTLLDDNGRLQCDFKVGDKVYPISIGVGTVLMVEKNADGKYILLPDETIKFSAPLEK